MIDYIEGHIKAHDRLYRRSY